MSSIQYQWVADDLSLKAVCERASEANFIMLDTEFVRERSFYPKLGLIQLYDGKQVSLIDPLAISDFSPFVALLANQKIIKVLHASGEDLEVFQHQFQQLPTPLLDTQIMAGFLSLGVSAGFAKLVEQLCQISLDKGASRTNWLARPLSDIQKHYAVADVFYLFPVFEKLYAQYLQSPWKLAIEQECQQLLHKRQVKADPMKSYKEIAQAWRLSPQELSVLQLLAKWRLEQAEKRDLAVNFVVKEQNLWQIAKLQPKHTAQLLEFMHPNEVRIHGKKLLLLVEQAQTIEAENYPKPIERIIDLPNYKSLLKRLQQALESIKPNELAAELLASKRQLNQLIKWHLKGQAEEKLPELMTGWRKVYGEQLLLVLAD